MKPEEKIERLLNDMNVTPDPEKDEQVLKAVLAAQVETRQHTAVNMKPQIWRMIMHSKITKPIAAAIIIIVGIIAMILPNEPSAWAIEQSIEAMRDFRGIRLSLKLPTALLQPIYGKLGIQDSSDNPDTQVEIWLRADEAMSRSSVFKFVWPGKFVAVGGQKRQSHIQLTDGTTYDAPSFDIWLRWPSTVLSMLLKEQDIKGLKEITERKELKEGKDTWTKLVGVDAEAGKERLYLKGNSLDANQSFELEFDVETKLLVGVKFWLGNTNHQGPPSGQFHKIIYYEDLPDSVFEIDLPSADEIIPIDLP
jgi:hypothetical protein